MIATIAIPLGVKKLMTSELTKGDGTNWSDYLTKGADAVGAIGTFMSGKTKTTPDTSKNGFESLPQDIKDFLMKQLFPDIKKSYLQARPTIMKRQYTDTEANDPLTGSKARQYMQQRLNEENVPSLSNQMSAPSPTAAPQADMQQAMQAKNLLREVQQSQAIQGGGYQGRQFKPMSQISLDDLMQLNTQGVMVGSGTQAGVLMDRNGKPIDLTRYYA